MTATALKSTLPRASAAPRVRATRAKAVRTVAPTVPLADSDPGLFVDQASVYGRTSKARTGAGRSLWLLAPVAAVAIGGVAYLTTFQGSGHGAATHETQTATTQHIATTTVTPPVLAPVVTPQDPAAPAITTTTTRVAVQRHTVVRHAVTGVPVPAEQSPAAGLTANVSAPLAPVTPAPAVAVNPPPVLLPAPNAAADAAPVGTVATTAPPADPALQ